MAGEIRRAPGCGPARRAADPEMAQRGRAGGRNADVERQGHAPGGQHLAAPGQRVPALRVRPRSEEHTSELQSRSDLVCRLLLEKKKKLRGRSRRVKNKLTHARRDRTAGFATLSLLQTAYDQNATTPACIPAA